MDHRDAAPSTVVLQSAGGTQLHFDSGRAALQVTTAVQSAPLWAADLFLTAQATGVAALVLLAAGAYTVATGTESAWPLPSAQPVPLLLCVGWMLAAWRRGRQLMAAMLYATIGTMVLDSALLFWWIVSFRDVRAHSPALWWTLTVAVAIEWLCIVGAAIALGNLLNCRLICDGHACTRSALIRRTEAQLRRGDRGDGRAEPRLAAGALVMHDLATAGGQSSAKKTE